MVAAQSALAEANVDTAALQDAIVAADKLVESDYTADSWKAFSAALATAKNVLANPTTQQAADDALHALADAQAALVKVAPRPTRIPIRNRRRSLIPLPIRNRRRSLIPTRIRSLATLMLPVCSRRLNRRSS